MNDWTAPRYEQPDASGLTEGGLPEAAIPTVKVKSADTESGFVIINESDLNDTHELYVDPVAAPAGKKKA